MNPSLEASWRNPWRHALHTRATIRLRGDFRGTLGQLKQRDY
ncbi:hypothetical protein [Halorhodospira halochloris]|nr:hypothetical protein [Halorhodospira halochloris]